MRNIFSFFKGETGSMHRDVSVKSKEGSSALEGVFDIFLNDFGIDLNDCPEALRAVAEIAVETKLRPAFPLILEICRDKRFVRSVHGSSDEEHLMDIKGLNFKKIFSHIDALPQGEPYRSVRRFFYALAEDKGQLQDLPLEALASDPDGNPYEPEVLPLEALEPITEVPVLDPSLRHKPASYGLADTLLEPDASEDEGISHAEVDGDDEEPTSFIAPPLEMPNSSLGGK